MRRGWPARSFRLRRLRQIWLYRVSGRVISFTRLSYRISIFAINHMIRATCISAPRAVCRDMNLPALYHSLILWIGDGTGLPDAILHIHAGLAILMISRLLSRRSLGTFIPFVFVVVAELANETMDYLAYGLRWADTLSDLGNTLFWPAVISAGVRLRPMTRKDQRSEQRRDRQTVS